ncbi:hypothetical protein [Streptomyces sp. NTH33]|uniref:hypothetical protein n=1 Tax=Streptomyces sp. NTH33 TaxID=1735453 RepID=UPI000DA88A04|nr:hypothetical protein [Streptomyces sp. NTH33]
MASTATDPKVAALAAARSLNPHPEKVVDEAFLASPFCDCRRTRERPHPRTDERGQFLMR